MPDTPSEPRTTFTPCFGNMLVREIESMKMEERTIASLTISTVTCPYSNCFSLMQQLPIEQSFARAVCDLRIVIFNDFSTFGRF